MKATRPCLLALAVALVFDGVAAGQTFSANSHAAAIPSGGAPQGVACGPTQITESVAQSIVGGNSVSCNTGSPGFFHTDNSYYRAFNLPSFGINGTFNVCEVQIGVEQAVSPGAVGQPLTVNLYTNSGGPFPAGSLSPIGTSSVTVADQLLTILSLPVTGTALPGSELVVEIFTPDGTIVGNSFFIGSNAVGQTAPSYIKAAACGIVVPTDIVAIGFPNMHIVMNVRGTEAIGVVPPGPSECGAPTPLVFSNPAVIPIPDVSVATSTINVSGAGPYLWDLGVLTNILHTFASDLDITITSPAGTVVTLTTDNGGVRDNVFNGTIWDDQADPDSQVPYAGNPAIVTDHTYTNLVTATPLAPEEALGAFIGENPNGTWTLTISDDTALDVGQLNGWTLAVASLSNGPSVATFLSSSNSTPVPIADLSVVTSTINMPSGIGTRICKLTANTAITHTYNSDLGITLMSPSGTIVTLTTNNGGFNDDVFNGTLWDDQANPGGQVPYTNNDGLATDQLYVDLVTATPLAPEEPLAAFNGENPAGTWTLTISDDAAPDLGTLNSWTLNFKTCTCAVSLADNPLRVDEHVGGSTSSNLNGVFEVGETVQVEPSWMNSGGTAFILSTNANNFTGPAGPTYTFVDNFADYGTVAPFSTNNCYDVTGNCYEMQVTGTRPIQHWDATFDEVALPIAAPTVVPYFETWTLHVGESFPDVLTSNLFYRFIENLFHNGITGGCAGGNYCPGNSVTRAQMAVFLLKSEHGSGYVPPACAGIFADVVCPSLFADWIERLFAEGITGGCGGGNYCPDNAVRRDQMAAFLLKAEHGSAYVPPGCTGVFPDVACPSLFADWIEQLSAEAITGGCGGGNYCPLSPNTRGQMAVFLVKTFGLILYGP